MVPDAGNPHDTAGAGQELVLQVSVAKPVLPHHLYNAAMNSWRYLLPVCLVSIVAKFKNRWEKKRAKQREGQKEAFDRGCWAHEVRKKLRVCELVPIYVAS